MVRWRYAPALALLALIPLAAAGDAPMPPGNLDYERIEAANGQVSVRLFWEAPTDTGSTALASYNVYRIVDNVVVPLASVDASSTEYTLTNLATTEPYALYVTAVNVGGDESLPSNAVLLVRDGAYPHCTWFSWGISPPGVRVRPECFLPVPV
jgi:hypothetical protein